MANKKYKLANSDYWETSGVYDLTEGKTQRAINAEVKGSLNIVEESVSDNNYAIANRSITGSINNTGEALPGGVYLWLNGNLIRTITVVNINDEFIEGTNYLPVTGGLTNSLIKAITLSGGNTVELMATVVFISRWFNGANKFALYTVDFSNTLSSPINTFGSGELTVTFSAGKFSITNKLSGVISITCL